MEDSSQTESTGKETRVKPVPTLPKRKSSKISTQKVCEELRN